MVTKVTFVGDNFTRKPPKFERFIRPMGLRFKKAHVTHPELKVGKIYIKKINCLSS
jgi:ribosome biogenesis protein NSA2